MKITPKLKEFAIKHFGLKATDVDAKFRQVIAAKLASGAMSPAQLAELSKAVGKSTPPAPTPSPSPSPASAKSTGISVEQLNSAVAAAVKSAVAEHVAKTSNSQDPITPALLFSKTTDVRVKSASEQYSAAKRAAVYPSKSGVNGSGSPHPLAGRPVEHCGLALDHPSDLDKAVAGAYFKWCLLSSSSPNQIPRSLRLTDHDKDLVQWAVRNMAWNGLINTNGDVEGGIKVARRKLNEMEIKALLDDSTSGGIEAAPIAFDDAMVLIPVLYGELFPGVKVVNVARGRRMKGAAMANPTFTSGTAEGTSITAYTTTGFVSAFDTTIYPAVGALEIGMDFEEDSPIGFGNQIVEAYGFKALEWLDRVIAYGNGTTEPLGIFNTTGAVVVNSTNGVGGGLTIGDHEGLMFGVSKAYRNEPGANNVFLANDTMYRRARGIPVGATDERRVFGMDHGGYNILQTPYKVNNSLPNGYIAYANLNRYRMYRRLGLQVRIETSGKTLALLNQRLIVVRMRYGGQMETGGAVSVMTDAQQ